MQLWKLESSLQVYNDNTIIFFFLQEQKYYALECDKKFVAFSEKFQDTTKKQILNE